MARKENINLVFVGHVDHGKSTTVGRLLYDTGFFPEQVLKKYKSEAEKIGKGSFEFAWMMDTLKEERERGVTIDVSHKKFETQKNYFTIIDAPGHRDFVKNMITGASQADAAVLVVAGTDGIMAQTKEHAFLAKTLGINQFVVAINKMDAIKPAYSESRYNEVKNDLVKLLTPIGFKVAEIPFVPISSYEGDNVGKKSDKMPWYKGPSLLEAMDAFKVPSKPTDKPLRLPIQDVYSITGAGVVPVGRVETGIMKVEDKVIIMPAGVPGEVKSIEEHHEQIPEALPGDNIGFNLRGVDKKSIKRGDVVGHPSSPPTVADEFTAQIVILEHPGAITVGYTPVFHVHTAQVACTFIELIKKIDLRTGETKEEHPQFLKTGEGAVVKIKPTKPLCIEPAKEFPQLGRFAVRDMGQTVAAGIVLEVKKKA